MKHKLYNLAIRKQLRYNTLLILIIVCLTAILGLINQLRMNSRLLSFYEDSYTIHTQALYSKDSLLLIQNSMYRAIATEKPNLQSKYINESEAAYAQMETIISQLCNSSKEIRSLTTEDQDELILELEKLQRYRKQIVTATTSGNVEAVFKTYKNDYVPILTSISTTLDHIIENANGYTHTYIRLSKQQTLLSVFLYICLTLLGTIVAIQVSKRTASRILTPIEEITICMNEMTKGNLQYDITYSSANELGMVCNAVRSMCSQLNSYIKDITSVLQELANRNLTTQPSKEYIGDFQPIKVSLESIIQFYNENITQIKDSCIQINEVTKQIEHQSDTIRQSAQVQSSTTLELTKSIRTVSDHATKNASMANQLLNISNQMKDDVKQAQDNMELLMNKVTSIEEQSNQIATIVDVIETIARKTQLVSLNASIEAAHANKTGDTFLVVAHEMSSLSLQCMNAAATIKPFINTTLEDIKNCTNSAITTNNSLDSTGNISNTMHTLVSSIQSSSQIQHDLIEQITLELPRILQISDTNEKIAKQSVNSIQEHVFEMNKLLNFVQYFRL